MRAERQRVGRIASAKGYGRPTERIESKKVSKRKYYCTVNLHAKQLSTNAYCNVTAKFIDFQHWTLIMH
jgi:hypothetical protein